MTRCTRQLHLLEGGSESGEPEGLRKELLLARLETLVGVMAVDVSAFAIMDNHVHLVLRIDREEAAGWTKADVLRRWRSLHPLRDGHNRPREATEEETADDLRNDSFLAKCREKLVSLSQFMKEFKQHAAEQINALEQAEGPVWAGRFKSKLIQDEEQLVATLVYVDLNPFAAGLCDRPEDGRHTSLEARLGRDVSATVSNDHPLETNREKPADGERNGKRNVSEAHRSPAAAWLRPFDESAEGQARRGHRPLADGEAVRAASAGTVVASLSLQTYLKLIAAVADRLRNAKKRIHSQTRSALERVGVDAEAIACGVHALVAQHHSRAT